MGNLQRTLPIAGPMASPRWAPSQTERGPRGSLARSCSGSAWPGDAMLLGEKFQISGGSANSGVWQSWCGPIPAHPLPTKRDARLGIGQSCGEVRGIADWNRCPWQKSGRRCEPICSRGGARFAKPSLENAQPTALENGCVPVH
jgi:hypothetical protein